MDFDEQTIYCFFSFVWYINIEVVIVFPLLLKENWDLLENNKLTICPSLNIREVRASLFSKLLNWF